MSDPWIGDGAEPPPASVTKVRDAAGHILIRQGDRNRWRGTNGGRYTDWETGWFSVFAHNGPWTEVTG